MRYGGVFGPAYQYRAKLRALVAVVVDSPTARALLAGSGCRPTPATFAPARAPPQAELWFDQAP